MVRKVLESCPSCDGTLEVTEMHCLNCGARVQAHFRTCDFCSLNDEQSTFLRIFLTSRGNLSEVEKRLGVSYPTVRAKLDEVIARLETPRHEPAPQATLGGHRQAILEAIARGEISAMDGLEHLRALGQSS